MGNLVADELDILIVLGIEPQVLPDGGEEELPVDFPIDPHVDTKTPPPEDEDLPVDFPIDTDPDNTSSGS